MGKQKEGCAPRGLAPPRPDPRHPEAVLETVARAAGIDVHKMSLTCTVLVEDASGRVESETRQYRTYGAELDLLVRWLADLDLARVVMESTGVFWKTVQRALAAASVEVWVVNARHVKECDPQCKTSYAVEPTCSFGSGTESGAFGFRFSLSILATAVLSGNA